MTITTIIFDLGNVVLTNDWHYKCPEKFREYSNYFNISYDDMERGWNAYWPEFSIGKINEDKFWNGFLKTAGAKIINVEYAMNLWRRHQRPIENMLDLLKELKKHYTLAALATISKEWLDYKKEKYKLNEYFKLIISSGYSGISKPNPKIYNLIIKKLKIKANECLFIDDAQICLPPAEKMGMKTILFKGQKDLERKLKKLGLKF